MKITDQRELLWLPIHYSESSAWNSLHAACLQTSLPLVFRAWLLPCSHPHIWGDLFHLPTLVQCIKPLTLTPLPPMPAIDPEEMQAFNIPSINCNLRERIFWLTKRWTRVHSICESLLSRTDFFPSFGALKQLSLGFESQKTLEKALDLHILPAQYRMWITLLYPQAISIRSQIWERRGFDKFTFFKEGL